MEGIYVTPPLPRPPSDPPPCLSCALVCGVITLAISHANGLLVEWARLFKAGHPKKTCGVLNHAGIVYVVFTRINKGFLRS